eukprot:6483962-Amphidinium_carterae.1
MITSQRLAVCLALLCLNVIMCSNFSFASGFMILVGITIPMFVASFISEIFNVRRECLADIVERAAEDFDIQISRHSEGHGLDAVTHRDAKDSVGQESAPETTITAFQSSEDESVSSGLRHRDGVCVIGSPSLGCSSRTMFTEMFIGICVRFHHTGHPLMFRGNCLCRSNF